MNNFSLRLLTVAALLCGVFFLANCGGGTTTNTATPKTDAPKTDAPKTDAPKTDAPKADAPKTDAADSVGVPECDEYIKKYEACLTKITEKAPQAQPGLKSAFEQQRKGFKDLAANPTTKAGLPNACKQAMDAAKQSTSAYACEW